MPRPRLSTLQSTPSSWIRSPPLTLPFLAPSLVFSRSASSRSPSSNVWIQRQRNDPFVKQRHSPLSQLPVSSFVSRSAFKLLDLHTRSLKQDHKLLRPGMTIVDLGAAPGGWIQAASEVLRGKGIVVGVDLLPLQREIGGLEGVSFVKGDFLDPTIQRKVKHALVQATGQKSPRVDLVLSDMMANTTGSSLRDSSLSLLLCESALSFALQHLSPSTSSPTQFIAKHFSSSHTKAFQERLRGYFTEVRWVKPESSRKESKEGFFVCGGLRESGEWPVNEEMGDCEGKVKEEEGKEDDLYF